MASTPTPPPPPPPPPGIRWRQGLRPEEVRGEDSPGEALDAHAGEVVEAEQNRSLSPPRMNSLMTFEDQALEDAVLGFRMQTCELSPSSTVML